MCSLCSFYVSVLQSGEKTEQLCQIIFKLFFVHYQNMMCLEFRKIIYTRENVWVNSVLTFYLSIHQLPIATSFIPVSLFIF